MTERGLQFGPYQEVKVLLRRMWKSAGGTIPRLFYDMNFAV